MHKTKAFRKRKKTEAAKCKENTNMEKGAVFTINRISESGWDISVAWLYLAMTDPVVINVGRIKRL